MLREIPGPVGRLEALLDEPAAGVDVRAAVVFAHPHPQYGGTMHSKVVYQAAKALGRIGCAVLRFNFRGVGSSAGAFDEGVGESDDFRAGLDFMQQQYQGVRLWAGGFSFGAWIALTVAVQNSRVSTMIGIAPPIARYDMEAVRRSAKAKFFIQGERDELCPLKEMQEFYAHCEEPKELVVIDAADHLFDGKTSEVGDAIEDLLGDWET
jgi:alpha/beta superfamily hydrolase